MSYVVAVIVQEGIVALADTRITAGSEKLHNDKMWVDPRPEQHFFALFAGNRFWTEEVLRQLGRDLAWQQSATVAEFADWLGLCLIDIRDKRHVLLEKSGASLAFDLGLIMGGQGPRDEKQDVRFVFQAGNHVTYSENAPYHYSGATAYGKFVLSDGIFYRRNSDQGSSLQEALAGALLSMHAVQSSVTTVDYPVRLLVWPTAGPHQDVTLRQADLRPFRRKWREHLRTFLGEAPLPPGVCL